MESAAYFDEEKDCWQVRSGENSTGIFIYPGYEFRIIDSLITNFHLPKSTLLMLISALYDREKILEVYQEAIREKVQIFQLRRCDVHRVAGRTYMAAKQEHVTHEFGAFYDENSKILILGTIPSPKSREMGFYYGHPRNRFWKVLAQLLDEPFPETVDERKAMLKKHGIALWDVLASCEITWCCGFQHKGSGAQ